MAFNVKPPLASLTFWGEKRLIVTVQSSQSLTQDVNTFLAAVTANLGPVNSQSQYQQTNSIVYENQ